MLGAVAGDIMGSVYEFTGQKRYDLEIQHYIMARFQYDLMRIVDEIRPGYQWNVSCQDSVPESIICFLEGKDFVDAVRLAVLLGGDADTMVSIAGSIAACIYPIPEETEMKCMEVLPAKLQNEIKAFMHLTWFK